MCRDHLSGNEKYRDGYDRIFGHRCELCGLRHKDTDTCLGDMS